MSFDALPIFVISALNKPDPSLGTADNVRIYMYSFTGPITSQNFGENTKSNQFNYRTSLFDNVKILMSKQRINRIRSRIALKMIIDDFSSRTFGYSGCLPIELLQIIFLETGLFLPNDSFQFFRERLSILRNYNIYEIIHYGSLEIIEDFFTPEKWKNLFFELSTKARLVENDIIDNYLHTKIAYGRGSIASYGNTFYLKDFNILYISDPPIGIYFENTSYVTTLESDITALDTSTTESRFSSKTKDRCPKSVITNYNVNIMTNTLFLLLRTNTLSSLSNDEELWMLISKLLPSLNTLEESSLYTIYRTIYSAKEYDSCIMSIRKSSPVSIKFSKNNGNFEKNQRGSMNREFWDAPSQILKANFYRYRGTPKKFSDERTPLETGNEIIIEIILQVWNLRYAGGPGYKINNLPSYNFSRFIIDLETIDVNAVWRLCDKKNDIISEKFIMKHRGQMGYYLVQLFRNPDYNAIIIFLIFGNNRRSYLSKLRRAIRDLDDETPAIDSANRILERRMNHESPQNFHNLLFPEDLSKFDSLLREACDFRKHKDIFVSFKEIYSQISEDIKRENPLRILIDLEALTLRSMIFRLISIIRILQYTRDYPKTVYQFKLFNHYTPIHTHRSNIWDTLKCLLNLIFICCFEERFKRLNVCYIFSSTPNTETQIVDLCQRGPNGITGYHFKLEALLTNIQNLMIETESLSKTQIISRIMDCDTYILPSD